MHRRCNLWPSTGVETQSLWSFCNSDRPRWVVLSHSSTPSSDQEERTSQPDWLSSRLASPARAPSLSNFLVRLRYLIDHARTRRASPRGQAATSSYQESNGRSVHSTAGRKYASHRTVSSFGIGWPGPQRRVGRREVRLSYLHHSADPAGCCIRWIHEDEFAGNSSRNPPPRRPRRRAGPLRESQRVRCASLCTHTCERRPRDRARYLESRGTLRSTRKSGWCPGPDSNRHGVSPKGFSYSLQLSLLYPDRAHLESGLYLCHIVSADGPDAT